MGRIADLKKQEQERRKKRKNRFLVIMIVIGVIVAFSIIPILGTVGALVIGTIIALVPLIVNAAFDAGEDIARGEEDLVKKIKEQFAPELINNAMPQASYFPYEGIEEEVYKLAEHPETFNEYKSSDKIVNVLSIDQNKNVEIEFAQIELKKDVKDKKYFIGVFGVAKLPKDIRSKIKINKEGTYQNGNIFKINVSDNAFEKVFDVMSPNKILANKVMTTKLMNDILTICNTYGCIVEITMIRDKVYLVINSGSMIKDIKDGKIIDKIIMEKHYNMLKPISELVLEIYKIVENIDI